LCSYLLGVCFFCLHAALRLLFFSIIPPPPSSTLFPYTTLFRSCSLRPTARSPEGCWSPCSSSPSSSSGWRTRSRSSSTSTSPRRSEEHTSELQSHLNLVCRLLLEKKKTNNERQMHHSNDGRRMY